MESILNGEHSWTAFVPASQHQINLGVLHLEFEMGEIRASQNMLLAEVSLPDVSRVRASREFPASVVLRS